MSRTVTTRRRNRPLLLQNETDGRARNKSSQSVTSEVDFAELLLQIEIFGDPESLRGKTTAKVPVPIVVVLTFAQIKPAKINLSLFGRF